MRFRPTLSLRSLDAAKADNQYFLVYSQARCSSCDNVPSEESCLLLHSCPMHIVDTRVALFLAMLGMIKIVAGSYSLTSLVETTRPIETRSN